MTTERPGDVTTLLRELERALSEAKTDKGAEDAQRVEDAITLLLASVDRAYASAERVWSELRAEVKAIADEARASRGPRVPRSYSIVLARKLTTYLERDLPPALVPAFGRKVSRIKGAGYLDTITLNGKAQAEALYALLIEARTASGQYAVANRAIATLGAMLGKKPSK